MALAPRCSWFGGSNSVCLGCEPEYCWWWIGMCGEMIGSQGKIEIIEVFLLFLQLLVFLALFYVIGGAVLDVGAGDEIRLFFYRMGF